MADGWMEATWLRLLAVLAAVLIVTESGVASRTDDAPDLSVTLLQMDSYLSLYEAKLSQFTADENFVQKTKLPRQFEFVAPQAVPHQPALERRIESEVAFISLPDEGGWLGFRHVKRIDGKAVGNSSAVLGSALQEKGLLTARQLLSDSAKFNLGLPRTTNLPNLPLEFLRGRNRSRLSASIDGREKVRGTMAIRLLFREVGSPTMIKTVEGDRDMPSVVRAWIRENSGELMQASVETFALSAPKSAEQSVEVDFASVKGVDVPVPVAMREKFPVERPSIGTGVASYSNFRRFQTSARIVPE